jgi:hypothetical protein
VGTVKLQSVKNALRSLDKFLEELSVGAKEIVVNVEKLVD